MKRSQGVLLGVSIVVLGAAFALWPRASAAPGARIYFYDLSEKKLYPVPRDSFAPEKGIGGESGDGVEAIVVRCPQCGAAGQRIAFLRTHTPEFKQRDEEGRRSGLGIPDITREYTSANTLVRPVDGTEWQKTSAKEGSKIVAGTKRRCATHGQWEEVCMP
jgi:hypothetical protein